MSHTNRHAGGSLTHADDINIHCICPGEASTAAGLHRKQVTRQLHFFKVGDTQNRTLAAEIFVWIKM